MAASAGRHLPWVDRARGGAVALVVLHHATLATLALGVSGDRWAEVDGLLAGMRLPIFFFVSGVLAARAVERPWRTLLGGKVANLAWLYVLWLVLASLLYSVMPFARSLDVSPDVLRTWGGAAHAFDLPTSSLWYLYALALFSILGRLVRKVPTVPLLVVAAVVSVALVTVDALATDNYTWTAVGRLFPFFLAGVRLGDLAVRVVPRIPTVVGAAALVGSPALVVASWYLPVVMPRPGMHLAVGSLAVVGGVVVASRLPDVAPVRALARLGTLTLPVYVLHELVMTVVAAVWLRSFAAGDPSLAPAWAALLPLALAAFSLAASLVVHRVLRRVPGLFSLPPGAARRLQGQPRTRTDRAPVTARLG